MTVSTLYADVHGARVAYQVFGHGPPTIVMSAGSFSNCDVLWEDPQAALFLTRLGAFARGVRYDKLGTSNSDPYPADREPSMDADVAELEAVLDAVGADDVTLWAMLDAGAVAIEYAVRRPERVDRLVLYNTTARMRTADDYAIGVPDAVLDVVRSAIDTTWGTDAQVAMNVPSRVGDETFANWYSKYVRAIGTPTTMTRALLGAFDRDVRDRLSRVRVPTLVIHRADYALVPATHGRYLAERIDGATYIEVPGADGPVFWEHPREILDAVRTFLARDDAITATATIATILFSDIIDSTAKAEHMGDREWSSVRTVHDDIAATVVAGHRGRFVKSTGDGILATFGDPSAAVDAARELADRLEGIGLSIRAGIHTGQVEDLGADVGGLAVNIAARVMGEAPGADVMVSRTVRDLLLGTRYHFEFHGEVTLKGIEGKWQLYRLA